MQTKSESNLFSIKTDILVLLRVCEHSPDWDYLSGPISKYRWETRPDKQTT